MKQTILLVDDQDELREVLSESFRARGYEVTGVADGNSLKELLNGPQFDLVLLDLKLPDADGLDLLSILKKQWADTEVIVLSGFGTLDLAVEATF